MHVPMVGILTSNGTFQLINHKMGCNYETHEHTQDIERLRVARRNDYGIKRTGPDARRLWLQHGFWHDGRLWRRLDGRWDDMDGLACHRGCRPGGLVRRAKEKVIG